MLALRIDGSDVTDLQLVATKPSTIRGRVAFEQGGTPPKASTIRVTAMRADSLIGGGGGVTVKDDLSFEMPLRQAFVNGVIPSEQRATVLSFDNLMASAGGVVIQPGLGRVADLYGYPAAYVASAVISALAVPFVVLARRENAPSDPITASEPGLS